MLPAEPALPHGISPTAGSNCLRISEQSNNLFAGFSNKQLAIYKVKLQGQVPYRHESNQGHWRNQVPQIFSIESGRSSKASQWNSKLPKLRRQFQLARPCQTRLQSVSVFSSVRFYLSTGAATSVDFGLIWLRRLKRCNRWNVL